MNDKHYTLYMDDEIIDSSDDLGYLVDKFEDLFAEGKDGLIMDNLTDTVAYN